MAGVTGVARAITCKRSWDSACGRRSHAAAAVVNCNVDQERWIQQHLVAVDKSMWSKAVEVQRVWDIHGEKLQFMAVPHVRAFESALQGRDVCAAEVIWSLAVEGALAEAFWLAGGPVPSNGLDGGRGAARFRTVQLVSGSSEGEDVCLYRDASVAPVLGLRCRLKAAGDALDGVLRREVTLSRALELSGQWDRILHFGVLVSGL